MRSAPIRHAGRLGLAVLLCAMLAGCAASKPDFAVPPTGDDPLSPARAALASGNELSAIDKLNRFLQENPGSALIDEANYLLGQANLAQKDRVLAADFFQKVTRDFPQSRFAPDAAYYQAVCYDELSRPSQLDQDWTDRAIGSYRLFAARYPDHPQVAQANERVRELTDRLAQKSYENAVLYLKMRLPTSAEVYFKRVMTDFPGSKWVCPATMGLGEAQMKKHFWREAAEQFEKVQADCPDKDLQDRAGKLLARARQELSRMTPAAADSVGPADTTAASRGGS